MTNPIPSPLLYTTGDALAKFGLKGWTREGPPYKLGRELSLRGFTPGDSHDAKRAFPYD